MCSFSVVAGCQMSATGVSCQRYLADEVNTPKIRSDASTTTSTYILVSLYCYLPRRQTFCCNNNFEW